MKKLITLLFAFCAVTTVYAQNSNPWPTSGNVGIGTSSPGSLLSIYGSDPGIFKSLALTNAAIGSGAGTSIYMGYDAQGGNPYGIRLLQTGYPTSTRSGTFAIQRHGITPGEDWISSLFIDFSGNVGIGTATPTAPLDVKIATNQNIKFVANVNGGYAGAPGIIALNDANTSYTPLGFYANSYYFGGGNIGIGTTSPDSKLTVNGTVHSKSVVVDMSIFADYVFHPNYTLPSLPSVNAYIKKNRHLPDVPSQEEVANKGLDLGEMNKLLVKKVEELTLYAIESNRKNTEQQAALVTQKRKLSAQESRLRLLEAKMNSLITRSK